MKRSVRSFGGLNVPFNNYDSARFVVLPVPYEKTTSYMKGAAKGPAAIIDASRYLELYDEELDYNPAESGIHTLKPLSVNAKPEVMISRVKETVLRILVDGKTPIVLGGEHSITAGAVAAIRVHHGDFSILQFDAHADLRDNYHDSRFSHACTMARAREHADSVQVGIRSVGVDESDLVKKLRGDGRLYFASDILKRDCTSDIIAGLKDKVYITFDVDCLDPSIMPSTGTPEPGGLGWYQTLGIIREISRKRTVVGFDVMELMPNRQNRSPDFTAAKLTYKMIGYVNASRL